MKAYFSVSELLDLGLPELPASKTGMIKRVSSGCWQFREVAGRGGKGGKKREYLPPPEIQAAIVRQQQEKVLAQSAPLPAVSAAPPALPNADSAALLNGSTQAQRDRAGARLAVLDKVEELMAQTKCGKEAAITTLLTSAKHPAGAHLAQMLRLANDKRGGGADLPSSRTVKRWFAARAAASDAPRDGMAAALLPKLPQAAVRAPEWFGRFMQFYRVPSAPSVQAAFGLFLRAEAAAGRVSDLPSVHQARRWLAKTGGVERERGRLGSRKIKDLLPFKRRKFNDLLAGEIWSADGHTFDAEVKHPDSGKPFRPEITTIVDIASRRIVGWSADLAESAGAVLSAVVHGVRENGIPLVFYVDNGKGYKNQMMSDAATGLMGRLGIDMTHSLPYSSRARGVIERLHQTVWVKAAQRLPTYIGAKMDAQAGNAVHKATRGKSSLEVALKTAPALRNMARLGGSLLPEWHDFVAFAQQCVAEYNDTPHGSLPECWDKGGFKRRRTPNEQWAILRAQAEDAQEWLPEKVESAESLYHFLPMVARVVRNGEVHLWNNVYFNKDLAEWHGETVRVAYDLQDGAHVWLFDDDGRYLGSAEFEGNSIRYMPQSYIERQKERRIGQQLARQDKRRADTEAAMPKPRALEHAAQVNIGGLPVDMARLKETAQVLSLTESRRGGQTEAAQMPPPEPAPSAPPREWVRPTDDMAQYREFKRLKTLPEGSLTAEQRRFAEWYAGTGAEAVLDGLQLKYG